MSKTLAWTMYAGLMTALLAATGAATADHEATCGAADEEIIVFKLDLRIWTTDCAGAVAETTAACFGGIDEDVGLAHVLVLGPGFGCPTGVVVDTSKFPDPNNVVINRPDPSKLLAYPLPA